MKSFIAALRSLVLPFGATSGPRIILDGVNGQISVNTAGTTRIVLGANTPPELVTFGISLAVLFYVTDSVTGVEVGYFFIGLSNVLDAGADNIVLLNGQVLYPVPGNPSSPTNLDVKTNYQMNMADPNSTNPSGTYFKDFVIFLQTSVPRMSMGWQTKLIRDNHDLGGGWVAGGTANSDNAPIVAAGEVVQLSAVDENFNPNVYRAGRAYVGRLSCELQTDAVGSAPFVRLRKTNAAGLLLGGARAGPTVAGFGFGFNYDFRFQVGVADVTAALVVTLQGLAGHTLQMRATDDISTIDIYEVGPASGARQFWTTLT